MKIQCAVCRKEPHEIEEYCPHQTRTTLEPAEYVKLEEGTYNPENGLFACTDCYCKLGMPSGPCGWTPHGFITMRPTP